MRWRQDREITCVRCGNIDNARFFVRDKGEAGSALIYRLCVCTNYIPRRRPGLSFVFPPLYVRPGPDYMLLARSLSRSNPPQLFHVFSTADVTPDSYCSNRSIANRHLYLLHVRMGADFLPLLFSPTFDITRDTDLDLFRPVTRTPTCALGIP